MNSESLSPSKTPWAPYKPSTVRSCLATNISPCHVGNRPLASSFGCFCRIGKRSDPFAGRYPKEIRPHPQILRMVWIIKIPGWIPSRSRERDAKHISWAIKVCENQVWHRPFNIQRAQVEGPGSKNTGSGLLHLRGA